MPHECTNCGRTFPDGSKEMLSGCPDCGGNKFQFAPSGRAATGPADSAPQEATDSAGDPGTDSTGDTGTVERAAETVRGWVSSDSTQSDELVQSVDTTAVDANRHDGSEQSWPSDDETPETDSTADSSDETGEFTEWPDTARRPEDRTTAPEEGRDEHEGSRSASDAEPGSGITEPTNAGTDSTHASPASSSGASAAGDAATDSAESISTVSSSDDGENTAQADARSDVVSADELPTGEQRTPETVADAGARADGLEPGAGDQPPEHGRVVSEPSGDQPSIEELRAELNEQFESIKIVSPGQYELNLMELYNREEYIISLQEDGRYVIDVPESWHADDNS
ncbi:OapC/ArvC family zinc-ribbon domain-containing protein [Natronorubrum halophilum]|uniref:OapC/ArvC family zinc-ribbon domain-containing protein n=1 Tax=Natronorubrum halophilum TaxID=1702106 RepID=UPI0010C21363|nr:Zn-ribbon containing protein [Natronorubrum halophilum]